MNPWAIAAIAWLPASVIAALVIGRWLRHATQAPAPGSWVAPGAGPPSHRARRRGPRPRVRGLAQEPAMTDPDCDLCGDTGWMGYADVDGDAYEIPCPNGCVTP